MPNPRKRQSSLQAPTGCNDLKRRKCVDGTRSSAPTAFWDNLSKIHLTRDALREIDRRNSSSATKTDRPTTRSLIRHKKPRVSPSPDELRRFARRGGPDMSEARGFKRPQPVRYRKKNPTPTPSDHSIQTSSTRKTTPYNANFEQHLIDNGIFPKGYKYPDGRTPPLPSNWQEINERLRVPLSSQVTREEYEKFVEADNSAFKEKQISTYVIPIIEGTVRDGKCIAGGIAFHNLKPITNGTTVPGNPDVYYGARPEQLDRYVREKFKDLIMPTTQEELPICPNFFVAAKGPNGTLAVALRQALYDGALGARGIHELRSYGQVQPASYASTITTIYEGGTLRLYTVHRDEPTQQYYMHQLRSFSMPDGFETFEQGVTVFRNARYWAEEQRNLIIEHANQVSSTTESEENHANLSEEDISSDSTRYTTPPDGEIDTNSTIDQELPSYANSNKRTRSQIGNASPDQRQKRNRVQRTSSAAVACEAAAQPVSSLED